MIFPIQIRFKLWVIIVFGRQSHRRHLISVVVETFRTLCSLIQIRFVLWVRLVFWVAILWQLLLDIAQDPFLCLVCLRNRRHEVCVCISKCICFSVLLDMCISLNLKWFYDLAKICTDYYNIIIWFICYTWIEYPHQLLNRAEHQNRQSIRLLRVHLRISFEYLTH